MPRPGDSLFSVIIPNHNHRRYPGDAIGSEAREVLAIYYNGLIAARMKAVPLASSLLD